MSNKLTLHPWDKQTHSPSVSICFAMHSTLLSWSTSSRQCRAWRSEHITLWYRSLQFRGINVNSLRFASMLEDHMLHHRNAMYSFSTVCFSLVSPIFLSASNWTCFQFKLAKCGMSNFKTDPQWIPQTRFFMWSISVPIICWKWHTLEYYIDDLSTNIVYWSIT